MGSPLKVRQDRKRRRLCVGCGGKPKAGRLRCEPCLRRQSAYDKAYREKQKGVTVEPQCKLPDGKMRADHVYGPVDGLCACGARRTDFAPRPPLRPEILRKVSIPWKPKLKAPPVPRPSAPAVRAAPKSAPKPREKRQPLAPAPKKHHPAIAAAISALESRRDQIDAAIATLRNIEE